MNVFSRFDQQLRDHGLPPVWLGALLLAFVAGNVIGLFSVGVHPDEAYYWVWSERLQAGYFDHPPMVAWVIRLCTGLFGDHPWVIRLPAVLAWLAINLSVYATTRDAFPGHRLPAWLAVLVATSLPLYQVGFHVVTADSPYLLFTALAYWALYLALVRDPRWWLVTGVFAGLSLLSKYIAVLFPAAVFLGLVATAKGRKHLLTPWPWLAIAIAAALFTPVVYWNARHDWVSFLFQLGHGIDLKREPSIINVLLYLASQLAIAMPWVLIAMIVASVKVRSLLTDREPVYAVLVSGFGLPLVFFALTGFTMISGAHWPAASYIPGSVLLGLLLGKWLVAGFGVDATGGRRRWPVVAIVASCLLSALLANAIRYRGNTQLANTFGWPELGKVVKKIYERRSPDRSCAIITDHKLTSAALAFALNMPHDVLAYPADKPSQYDLWRQDDEAESGRETCLLVTVSDAKEDFSRPRRTRDGREWKLERVHVMTSPVRNRWAAIYIPVTSGTD